MNFSRHAIDARTLRSWAGIVSNPPIRPQESALLLIDYQREYLDGKLPLPGAESAVARARLLVAMAEASAVPVIHIHHVSAKADAPLFAAGTPAVRAIPGLEPAAHHTTLSKTMPSAFHGTALAATLRERGIETLIIAGFMTHMCVDSTARDALHRGHRVVVVGEACATRSLPGGVEGETMHRASLAALADRFADVVDLEGLERMLPRSVPG